MDGEDRWFEPNKEYNFFGVDGYHFKLDAQVFEAIEDEGDGYRSYLDSVLVRDTSDLIFPRTPLDRITIVEVRDEGERDWKNYRAPFDGYNFVAADGHVWLQVGTNEWDDYYPYFVFRYTPREPEQENMA